MNLTLDELGLPSDVRVWHAVVLTLVSFAVGILGGFVGPRAGHDASAGATPAGGRLTHRRRHEHHREHRQRADGSRTPPQGRPGRRAHRAGHGGAQHDRGLHRRLQQRSRLRVAAAGGRRTPRVLAGRRVPSSDDPCSQRRYGRRRAIGARRASGRWAGRQPVSAFGLLGGAVGLILGRHTAARDNQGVLGADPRRAAGTNLFIGFVMGSMGWVGHVTRGTWTTRWSPSWAPAPWWAATSERGLTGRVSLDRLITTLGLVLLTVGALLVWRGVTGG